MSCNNIISIAAKWIIFFVLCSLTGTAYGQHHMGSGGMLTKPGNEVFGTIQEVVQKLEANPDTDWSQVDLEALRQHLLDMKAFTEDVEVLSQQEIKQGTKIIIRGTSERAGQALKRLFSMHPAMLKQETGWVMNATQNNEQWVITCTSDKPSEVEKIRGWGYIGLLAEGAHHQRHHWVIANGRHPQE